MLIGITSAIAFFRGRAGRERAPQHTISVEGTELSVDLKFVTYVYPEHDHTISVTGTGLLVDLIQQ